MTKVYDILLFGASMFIVLVIIGIAFYLLGSATKAGHDMITDVNSVTEDISGSHISKYDGAEVSGSEVINAVKRYQKEYAVQVVTLNSSTVYDGQFKLPDNKPGSTGYINPAKVFKGLVTKDPNDIITGIIFTQN